MNQIKIDKNQGFSEIDKFWMENSPLVMEYIYRGDKLARIGRWSGLHCKAVRRENGKCIRGKNSNMLVQFECGTKVVVLARQLRKLSK